MSARQAAITTHEQAPSLNGLHLLEQGLSSYQELWQIVTRRKGRIMAVLLFAFLCAGIVCILGGPWYDATAQLLVIKKRLDTTPITGPDQIRGQEDYLSTHMLVITSRRVIGHAIDKGGLEHLKQFSNQGGMAGELRDWFGQTFLGVEATARGKEQLTTDIINALVVSRDAQRPGISPSNEVINLSFRGKVAGDCPKIINAIIASYQDFLSETYRNSNAETMELITQARAMVQKDLEQKEAAYQKFLAATPPLWKTQDRSTAHQDRLIKIDARLSALRIRKTEIAASIAMIENALKSGRNPTAIVERMSAAPTAGATPAGSAQEPWVAELRSGLSMEGELVSLQLQKAKLLASRAPNHPDVLALGRHMDSVRRMISPSSGSQGLDGPSPHAEVGMVKVELLKQELDDLQVAEQALAGLFATEQQGVSASYIHEIQDEAHRKGIERDRLIYDSILNRLKETSTVKDFGGYTTEVIGAALPGRLALKKYLLIFGLAVFAGLLCGLAWAYRAELLSRKTHAAPAAA